MSDARPSEKTIRELAGRVATTEHAALDDETVDRVAELVEAIQDDIDGPESAAAIQDLQAFWDAYVLAGLADVVSDAYDYERATTLRERIERGNTADLYGLDIYQALLGVADAVETDAEADDAVPERAVEWADRLSDLTTDFVSHLKDHI
ncbi:hypothetical protein [Halanaeroarchaeum sulfurireducens]|uniref:Uncharacterized protein n=1 Tax=Halanaeroarchaeum sulfurireducens TaxID=1604004 RepID=A0A0N9MIW6_9EURY|nr:hypothetical protein [Halanaeroarchaeum sulfurireducens]ALG82174.1 hypothetical protein HLASA_1281 [Halanaeroarchaeum sulfurireducens]